MYRTCVPKLVGGNRSTSGSGADLDAVKGAGDHVQRSLKDVLDRLRERMLEQRSRGVTVAQMHEVLKARGIEMGERSLKVFLDKGELPGRKAAKVAAQLGGENAERDAF